MRIRPGGAARREAARGTGETAGDQSGPAPRRAQSAVDGRWLMLGHDGRLTAYARTPDGLLRWTESSPGGPRWEGPVFFPAPSITSLAVGQGADGFAHFVGRRTVRKNGADVVDVAHAIQYQSGRPLSEWHSLGNPRRDPATGTRVGTPVVAVAPGGSTYVFMENASGSLAVRRESAAGKWQPWQGIKGEGVRDGIAPVALESGLVEVLSPAEGAALYCHQPKADTDLVSGEDVPVAPAGHSLAGLETAPGRVTYYWTDAATHGVLAHRAGRVIPLGGSASEGRIAVLRAVIDGLDHTVTAHRATDGQIVVGICVTEDESAGMHWSPTGEHSIAAPALALDHQGRVVVAFLDAEGGLRIARQTGRGGFALAPAVRV
ncbi:MULTISPECIES: hypothetical protein [Streptomyces]|uniref:hypothetical protein n=1 Tax=Streptomyces TaxID=1883 RepID=UPI00055CD2A9|nr:MULTISPECIES: hypothetical protein [Streptomyces]AKL70315.1 hypothetical protein M444_26465 [Streptomyces sp. Mg1]WBY22610.1 hypothetical protein PET44_25025 [Streptomyces goshikiensis]WSS01426.1 hypothetical protein OG224_27150 [Streptomyces goshikiensis]WSX97524.1 hypothetical protein OG590_09890 [Streptomyces goshikiensis]